jgi:hypothetical protein
VSRLGMALFFGQPYLAWLGFVVVLQPAGPVWERQILGSQAFFTTPDSTSSQRINIKIPPHLLPPKPDPR